MDAATVMIAVKARDEASAVLTRVRGNAEKLGGAFKTAGVVAGAGIAAAGVAIAGFVKAAAEEQVGIERLQTAIKTLDATQQVNAAH
jgi:hypothetical protein